MALKSTVHKVEMNLADLDRQLYADYNLTVARHPSETEARMMLRLLAFALHADEQLAFGRGISTDDEPDLWRKSLSGDIELWIDLGNPEESRVRKACGRSGSVVLYAYGDRATPVWWEKQANKLQRQENLSVYSVSDAEMDALADACAAGMRLQCTVQEGGVLLSHDSGVCEIAPRQIK